MVKYLYTLILVFLSFALSSQACTLTALGDDLANINYGSNLEVYLESNGVKAVEAFAILSKAEYNNLRKGVESSGGQTFITIGKVKDLISGQNWPSSGLFNSDLYRSLRGNNNMGSYSVSASSLVDGYASLVASGSTFANFMRLLTDLEHSIYSFRKGAQWVQKYITKYPDEFLGKVLQFEFNVETGRIDLRVGGSDLYEFKSINSLPPEKFLEQMTRDLTEADGLANIHWRFDPIDFPSEVNGVKAFTQTDKTDLMNILQNMNLPQSVINKYIPGGTVSQVVNLINNEFDNIFKVPIP